MRSRLRTATILASTVCLAVGGVLIVLVCVGAIHPQAVIPAIGLLIFGGMMFLAMVFERTRYKPILTSPPEGWTQTAERFIDDRTQQTVEVYIHPQTGERAYVGSA